MQAIQIIRCPNCGSHAERFHVLGDRADQIQTQCDACDYLMITCSQTGNVVEAYAPGLPGRS